jgi:peptidoglycan/LPS O-acetylase OafA/YrhL
MNSGGSETMDMTRIVDNSIIRKGEYMPTLDGWRAIAILLVVVGHAMDDILSLLRLLGVSAEPGGMRYIGIHGVLIFFGLSGFLITSKLLADERQHGHISLWAFYVRRTFRILPATLFFLSAIGILAQAGILDISLGRWLSSLLFAANYTAADYSWYLGHFWSLAVEEHFYLLWPVLFLWLGAVRRRLAWAVGMACAVAVWRAIDFRFQLSGSSAAVFMGRTDIRVDHILWGVAVALAYADPWWRPRMQALLANGRVTALLLLSLAGLLFVYHVDWKLKFALLSMEGILVPLAIMSSYLNHQGSIARILEAPALRLIGRLSFSIYLWQQLFLVWADARIPALEAFQAFPVNIVALGVCAMISFWLIEEPCIALGRKVLGQWPSCGRQASRQFAMAQSTGKV